MQHCLKPAIGPTWARIIAAELFEEFLVPVHDAVAAFDPGFRRESLPTLTCCLETRTGRGVWSWASWDTSNEIPLGLGERIIAGLRKVVFSDQFVQNHHRSTHAGTSSASLSNSAGSRLCSESERVSIQFLETFYDSLFGSPSHYGFFPPVRALLLLRTADMAGQSS